MTPMMRLLKKFKPNHKTKSKKENKTVSLETPLETLLERLITGPQTLSNQDIKKVTKEDKTIVNPEPEEMLTEVDTEEGSEKETKVRIPTRTTKREKIPKRLSLKVKKTLKR